jgi:hypothetical protein
MTKTLKAVAASPRTTKTSNSAAAASRVSPGLARLRAHKDAEAIRTATLADNEAARAEIAAKLAETAPAAAFEYADKDVPAFLKAGKPSLSDMAGAVSAGEKIEMPEPAPEPAKPARERKVATSKPARKRRADSLIEGSTAAEAVDLALREEGVSFAKVASLLPRVALMTAYAWDAGCSIEKRDNVFFAIRVGRRQLRDTNPQAAAYYAKWKHIIPEA